MHRRGAWPRSTPRKARSSALRPPRARSPKRAQALNGTYTAALLQHIDTSDCSIETMFKRVRNTVAAETRGKQTSWEHTPLSGEFYFNMSLGRVIREYKETSLADRLFVIDTSQSHTGSSKA